MLTQPELELPENGLNINCSDLDLCELEGKTRVWYANGDQMTYSFLCEAEYDGPLNEFLAAFSGDKARRPDCLSDRPLILSSAS